MNRAAKAGALSFALVGLLLVVALASRGGPPTTDGRVSPQAVPATLQDSLVTLLAISYVLAIAAIVIMFFRRRPWHEPQDSRWLRNFLSVMALMLLASLFGYWAIRHGHFGRENERAQQGQGQGQTPGTPQRSPAQPLRTRPAEFQWPLALGIAGLIVLGGVLLVVVRRRSPIDASEDESVHEDLARAVQTTIDDLRREPDPRRAVIAAYAHMEGALASRGLARRTAETPFEYLTRILGELNVRDSAVRSLTRLFEYAKFSPHEIGEDMREEAISALMAVREDLLGEERVAA
jgi:Domain of unknown function (DUF4129)